MAVAKSLFTPHPLGRGAGGEGDGTATGLCTRHDAPNACEEIYTSAVL